MRIFPITSLYSKLKTKPKWIGGIELKPILQSRTWLKNGTNLYKAG